MILKFFHPEFEYEVRNSIKVYDRDITSQDANQIRELDLSNFDFKDEDIETLFHFSNLISLDINIGEQGGAFWSHFSKLEDLCWCCWGSKIDFSVFSDMKNLNSLCVSGGDYSDIEFNNLKFLINLKKLEFLELHEFGHADINPLKNMPQLKAFSLRYSNKVEHIDIIGEMVQLKELILDGLYVDNLDFLDTLPDNIYLEMCGIEIYGENNVNVEKWKRFAERDISEIMIKNKYWEYIDLSALND